MSPGTTPRTETRNGQGGDGDATVPASSPLAASFARLEAVTGGLRVELDVPSGGDGSAAREWVTGAQLARDPQRRDWLIEAELRHARRRLGLDPRRDVAATWVFQHYLWAASVLLGWPMVLDRRVPRLGVADVALYMPFDGALAAVAAPGSFACLPGDPAAGHTDARTLDDLGALREAARDAAREHFAPLVAAFGPDLRRGWRALWGTATDQLAGALWYLGRMLDDEPRGAEEARALLPGGTPPFPGSAGFRQVPGEDGRPSATRTRLTCCLFYTVRPEGVCGTCPRLTARPAS